MHCYNVAGQSGVVIFGYLDGYKSSSARIELVGLMLSLFSDLPLFIAVDNASVVRRAQLYHNWLLKNATVEPPGKPFGLLKNGDPWVIF